MKRYGPSWPDNNYGGDMFEEPDGEWVRYEDAQAEITRLRQQNDALKLQAEEDAVLAKVTMEEVTCLRQQVAELEGKLRTAETAAQVLGDDVYNLTEKVLPNLREKYRERGERMKEMRDFIKKRGTFTHGLAKWFNPETGEPL